MVSSPRAVATLPGLSSTAMGIPIHQVSRPMLLAQTTRPF